MVNLMDLLEGDLAKFIAVLPHHPWHLVRFHNKVASKMAIPALSSLLSNPAQT